MFHIMLVKWLVEGGPASLYGLVCIVWMYGGGGDFITYGAIICEFVCMYGFVAFDYGVSTYFYGCDLCLNHVMGCTTGG